jgi:PKD repeat protein
MPVLADPDGNRSLTGSVTDDFGNVTITPVATQSAASINVSDSQPETTGTLSVGTYNISLNVTNPLGSDMVTRVGYVTTNSVVVPVANFTANVTTGDAPLAVRFSDTSTGVPTTWNWSFGDGASSTVQHPVHTYTTAGTYNISLNVTNVAGSDVVTRVGYVTVMSGSDTYGLVTKWGTTGLGDGEFMDPTGVAVDSSGTVYVADSTRIQTFYSNGSFITKWGSGGSGITIDLSDNVYVLIGYQVQKFRSDGTLLKKWGTYGSGDGQFNYPSGIAVDSKGNVYVSDRHNHRIQKFSSDGTFVTKWGSEGLGAGEFKYPMGVTVDSSGNVYVADTNNNRIQKFNSVGTFLTKWGSFGSGDGQFYYPQGETVDSGGNVYVVDPSNNRIQKFSSNGTFLTKWGSLGSEDGQFYHPQGVTVDSVGNVYVADTENDRIQKFSQGFVVSTASFTANITAGTAPLPVQLTDTSTGFPTSWNWSFGDITWFNTTDHSQRNPSHTFTIGGTYIIRLTVSNAGGSTSTSSGTIITVNPATPTSGSGWKFRADLNNSGFYDDGGTRPNNILRWIYTTGGSDLSSLTIVDNVVYGGSGMNGNVFALNAVTGAKIWNFTTGSVYSSPTIANGVVYVGNSGNRIYALDAATGAKIWDYYVGSAVNGIYSSPAVANGIVYVGSTGGGVYALNATTGAKIWEYPTWEIEWSSPAVVNGVVYVASSNHDGWVYALNATTGAKIWDSYEGYGVDSSPAVANGVVYIGSGRMGSGKISALDASTGGIIWDYYGHPPSAWSSPAVANGIVYAGYSGSSNGGICAFTAATGTKIWEYTIGGGAGYSSPAIANGVVYIGGYGDYKIYALDAATGVKIWDYTTSYVIESSPVISNGVVYIGSKDGKVYAIGNAIIPPTPPTAYFTVNQTAGKVPLTVQFTDTSLNTPTIWNWSFGDGSSSTLKNPSHTYSSVGTFTVALTATNSAGSNTNTKTNYITVSSGVGAPVAAFTGSPLSGTAPLPVQFTDASTDSPIGWAWFFGDGASSTIQHPVHIYTTAGTYNVSLNVTNISGSDVMTRVGYVTVSPVVAPVANFTANVTTGNAPLTVAFTDTSTGSPTGWAWFFGNENWTAPWTQQSANAEGTARFYHSCVVMPDGSIVLMGGNANNGDSNDVWGSKDNGATWIQQTASAGWSARYGHSSVVMPDGSIVVMGGYSGVHYKNDVWRSTDNGATWIQQTASAGWSARYGHSSVVMPDGSIILMGGSSANSICKNDVWRSTDNGVTWILVTASAGWSARMLFSSVMMPDGSIVLMGGYDGSYKNDVWRSTDNCATWIQVTASAGWSARLFFSSVVMPDGSIMLMGGRESGSYNPRNDIWRSTDNGTTWIRVNASAGWSARYGHSSVMMPDGSIVLIGGTTNNGYSNDVWRFVTIGSSAQNPSHTYTTPGIYPVVLQTYNTGGSNTTTRYNYITVRIPAPVANFTATPTSGAVPLTVRFNDTSTNTPTQWTWNFGDGSSAVTQHPVHTYTTPGSYTVSLNATNTGGSNTKVITNYINVTPPPIIPIPNFTATPTSGTAPVTVTFTDNSTNAPTRWNWSFGDSQWFNTTDPLQRNPVHTYTDAGVFTVSLAAGNPNGTNILTRPGYITVAENTSYRARLILPDVSVYQNTSTKIPIQVANITEGTGLAFDLRYDPTAVRVNNITLNQSWTHGSNLVINSTPGLARVLLSRTDGLNIGAPTPLLIIDVTDTGAVGSLVHLTADNAQWSTRDFNTSPFNVIDGSVFVYRIRGDFNGNGVVDIGDVSRVAYMIVGLTPMDPAADFNGTGTVDVADAAKIAYYLVGKITQL